MERVLKEIELDIENFEEEYEGDTIKEKWEKVKEKVEMMMRANEEDVVDTALVTLVISDRAVREIGFMAFVGCVNLWKIKAPFVEEVSGYAFRRCRNLVEVVLPIISTFSFTFSHFSSIVSPSYSSSKFVISNSTSSNTLSVVAAPTAAIPKSDTKLA